MSSLIGKDIEAYCTKCKLVLNHVILTDINDIVSKVKCKTCGSEHKYRGPEAPKKKSSSPNTPLEKFAKLDPGIHKRFSTAPAQWEHKKNEMKPNHLIKIYRMQDNFQLKDVIQHHTFGLGFVEQIISSTKIEVLFCDALKRMVMNTVLF